MENDDLLVAIEGLNAGRLSDTTSGCVSVAIGSTDDPARKVTVKAQSVAHPLHFRPQSLVVL